MMSTDAFFQTLCCHEPKNVAPRLIFVFKAEDVLSPIYVTALTDLDNSLRQKGGYGHLENRTRRRKCGYNEERLYFAPSDSLQLSVLCHSLQLNFTTVSLHIATLLSNPDSNIT
jgi:hypothetical protein